jgi:hypothetical protein
LLSSTILLRWAGQTWTSWSSPAYTRIIRCVAGTEHGGSLGSPIVRPQTQSWVM